MERRKPTVLGTVATGGTLIAANALLAAGMAFGPVGVAAVAGGTAVVAVVGKRKSSSRARKPGSMFAAGSRVAKPRSSRVGGKSPKGATRGGSVPVRAAGRAGRPLASRVRSPRSGSKPGKGFGSGLGGKRSPGRVLGGGLGGKKTAAKSSKPGKAAKATLDSVRKGVGRGGAVPRSAQARKARQALKKTKKNAGKALGWLRRNRPDVKGVAAEVWADNLPWLRKLAKKVGSAKLLRPWTKRLDFEALVREKVAEKIGNPKHYQAVTRRQPAQTVNKPNMEGHNMNYDHIDYTHSGRANLFPLIMEALDSEMGRTLITAQDGGLAAMNVKESLEEVINKLAERLYDLKAQAVNAFPADAAMSSFYDTVNGQMAGMATYVKECRLSYAEAHKSEIQYAKSGNSQWDVSLNQR